MILYGPRCEMASMHGEYKMAVKSKSTLTEVRGPIGKDPAVEVAIQDSMAPPMALVGLWFSVHENQGKLLTFGVAATEQNIDEMFSICPICRSINSLHWPQRQRLLKTHCHCSHYVFQIKKCENPSCFYCLEHPIRLPHEDFSKFSFLLLPLLDPSNEHYQKFDMVYDIKMRGYADSQDVQVQM